MQRDLRIIKKRKKLWDHFDWGYKSPHQLLKRHSLNCGCNTCRMRTFLKRRDRRRDRHQNKVNLKNEDN